MKQFVITIILILNVSVLLAQDAKSLIHRGNQLYEQKKFKEAEADYRKAVEKKNENLTGNFNLGDALYKQKKFDHAAKNFTDIASTATNSSVKARAYHNLGNSMLETKKYEESIDAYKKSLLNNPKDDATRYNLAYAQEMLKKQQQQNKQNQHNNQQNQQNKDQNKNNKNDQDKKNQDKNNQGKNDQNKDPNQQNKDQDKKDQDKKDQQDQQQPNQISKDDAQRMLDALNNQEQGTQDKLKNKKLKGGQARILKDW
ncbi:tetratricopeptide repeat protein [Mucilaginibacter arboris]|uniref:Tetratricopeptide repeat protein n=1 Tax=Mucilaginibacter arboris TaxID=2682090 RepID=A0A7K1SZF5_9SPHI|nr:tetratricopeptide repeat protein [Mucilaginibacter arboris]MVN22637.1 tetratricopeptide repeat protein [Mucilaginibacter arboris]